MLYCLVEIRVDLKDCTCLQNICLRVDLSSPISITFLPNDVSFPIQGRKVTGTIDHVAAPALHFIKDRFISIRDDEKRSLSIF